MADDPGFLGGLTARHFQVSEMLLCADTFPESMLRQAVQVLATQCYTKVRAVRSGELEIHGMDLESVSFSFMGGRGGVGSGVASLEGVPLGVRCIALER